MDVIHRHAGDRLAAGERLRQLDLERVDARDVMYDDADLAAIPENASVPLRVGEGIGERRQCGGSLFETIGKRVAHVG